MIAIKHKLNVSPLDSFQKNNMLSKVKSPNHRTVQQMRPNKGKVQQLLSETVELKDLYV